MKVLCVAAHPDDEVLGVGGTLLRHKDAGDEVRIVLANKCRPEGDRESREAERRLGIPYVRAYDLEDDWWDPDIVYTHSLADLHHEHRELHEQVLVRSRPQSGVKAIYAFETPSATDWGMRPFVPTMFVDVEGQLDRKLHAMAAYESELRDIPHPRNLLCLETRAIYWGQRAGVMYAEAFEVIREVW